MDKTKVRFIKWIVRLLFGQDMEFTLCRKRWLKELAHKSNAMPNSKILTISILRLDGTSFDDAFSEYKKMNGEK
jgi:hypothetical protein